MEDQARSCSYGQQRQWKWKWQWKWQWNWRRWDQRLAAAWRVTSAHRAQAAAPAGRCAGGSDDDRNCARGAAAASCLCRRKPGSSANASEHSGFQLKQFAVLCVAAPSVGSPPRRSAGGPAAADAAVAAAAVAADAAHRASVPHSRRRILALHRSCAAAARCVAAARCSEQAAAGGAVRFIETVDRQCCCCRLRGSRDTKRCCRHSSRGCCIDNIVACVGHRARIRSECSS